MGIILQQVNLRGHTWGFQYCGTTLTSRVSSLTHSDFRWEMCLHSQSSTAHCSPVYSSFPHPFIPMASVKSKSTRGCAFGCPKTLSWVGGSVQHQQGKSSSCSSCSGKGKMLPGDTLHGVSESWARHCLKPGIICWSWQFKGDLPARLLPGINWILPWLVWGHTVLHQLETWPEVALHGKPEDWKGYKCSFLLESVF